MRRHTENIFAPILFPVARTLGIEPVHYGIIMIAAGGVGIFLPPIGIAFILAAAVGGADAEKATPAFLPYLVALVIGLGLVAFVPWFTMVLPQLLQMK